MAALQYGYEKLILSKSIISLRLFHPLKADLCLIFIEKENW